MINVAKRWGMTNIYRMKEIFGLVFINHEPGLERIDTNQKIPYGTAYYCTVIVLQAPVSIWHMNQKKGRSIQTNWFAKTLSTKQEEIPKMSCERIQEQCM